MNEQSISVTDALTGEDAVVIVRAVKGTIAICLSLETDGDAEIFFSPNDFQNLLSVLQTFEQ
ncbi:MAG TPA: hypothetical protein PKE66_12000 [Pyrinomonadaceae bacterium]|nr:hypothetical protein [Pyrinomonadaceae bacterium]